MIRVKINLANFITTLSNCNFTFYDVDEETIENASYTFNRITFSYNSLTSTHSVTIEYEVDNLPVTRTFTNSDILNISSTYIIFSGNILRSTIQSLNSEVNNNAYIEFNQDENVTISCYRQDDENDVINKSLSNIVDFIDGHFNSAIGLKNIDIDLTGFFARKFNYVYIEKFNRYYYVDSIELISNDYTRLHLKEDVLMSHKNVIYEQNAFVTRNESANTPHLVDNRLPLEDVISVEYIVPTPTGSTNTLVNTTLDTNITNTSNDNVVLSTMSDSTALAQYSVNPPDNSLLPSIYFTRAKNDYWYFMNVDTYKFSQIVKGIYKDDRLLPYVNSVIWLPFNPKPPFESACTDGYTTPLSIDFGELSIGEDGNIYNHNSYPSGVVLLKAPTTRASSSPYFVTSDFTLSLTDNWKNYSPYADYELYVSFAGWVKLDITQLINKRILIYYTIDFHSGNGNAYIYNYTDKKLIWSSSCQIGVKMDLTSSNSLELEKQKQALELNTILGLISSGIAMGGGIAHGNAVAVAGGVLSAGKTLANMVNAKSMMFEKGQVILGSGNSSVHAPIQTIIRKSYHKELAYTETSVYEHLQGYPYNAYVNLSDLQGDGYIEVGEIHFEPMGYDIYQDEISEIVSLLKEGVII